MGEHEQGWTAEMHLTRTSAAPWHAVLASNNLQSIQQQASPDHIKLPFAL